MSNLTTTADYDADLQSAEILIQTFVDYRDAGGNMRNWAQDALNNEWHEGLTIEQWVARALVRMNHGQ